MRIGWSTGYHENYWAGWPWSRMMGGSERIVTQVARELAKTHDVTVRLPYAFPDGHTRRDGGVTWIDADAPAQAYDVLFAADDYQPRDRADVLALVACRSDPPIHKDFDVRIYLSRTHAVLMGDPDSPYVGGGVDLLDYTEPKKRIPRRVICTSSPDRCPQATAIGNEFDLLHTYRPVGGVGQEMDRTALIAAQQSAMVHIYPLDPVRPSDFFSMSVLESLAAGTPVVTSDADAMPELWAECATIISRPIRLAEWVESVDDLMRDKRLWERHSKHGRLAAQRYTWDLQTARYLSLALEA